MGNQEKIQEALQAHQTGQLQQAELLYREILKDDPNQADALHLLGLLAHQFGHQDAAAELMHKALAVCPNEWKIENHLGVVEQAREQFVEAEKLFLSAFNHSKKDVSVAINLGNLLLTQNRLDEAEKVLSPYCFGEQRDGKLWLNYGMVKARKNDALKAISAFETACRIDPNLFEAHFNLGVQAMFIDQYELAEQALKAAMAVTAGPRVFVALGNLFLNQRQFDVSLQWFDKALELDGKFEPALSGKADLLRKMGNLQQALEFAEIATRDPNANATAWQILGVIDAELGQYDLADKAYRQAIQRDPTCYDAKHGLGLLALLKENWTEGWFLHECRLLGKNQTHFHPWRTGELTEKTFSQHPWWQGNHLGDDARLLVWGEQGLGDELLFSRMFSDMKNKAANITIECSPRLVSLFARSFPEYQFISRETGRKTGEDFDAHIASASLGKLFRNHTKDFNADVKTLAVDRQCLEEQQAWLNHVNPNGQAVMGIAWQSLNPVRGPGKSVQLNQLVSIIPDNTVLIDLQYGSHSNDIGDAASSRGIRIVEPAFDVTNDMERLAALVKLIGFIVSTPNALVDLAGCLNVTTNVLLPMVPDWRWGLNRHDSLWYPSITVHRQEIAGDWSAPLRNLREVIDAFTGNMRGT